MTQGLPENLLHSVSNYIVSHTGLYYPPGKWNALKKAMKLAAADYRMDVASFVGRLFDSSHSTNLMDALVAHLTIGETYFLRDKNLIQTLKDKIIQDIIDSKQGGRHSISFFSAGCATGEEAYSIAILMDHMFPVLKDWEVSIVGADINLNFLEKARQGIYSRWSLRETPDEIIKKYFIQIDANRFELSPRIKPMVKFERLNLKAADCAHAVNICGEVDILLCRNVLMYFDAASRDQVVDRLTKLIAKNGWFISGPSESGFIHANGLVPVKISNIILHQKKVPRTDASPRHNGLKGFKEIPLAAFPPKPSNSAKPLASDKHQSPKFQQERPTSVEIYEKALKDYQDGNYAAAAEKLSLLLTQPNHRGNVLIEADLMLLLAKSHANMGELDRADFWCSQAVASEKLNPEIHFFQSSIFQAAGKKKEAIESLKHAIYLDPHFIMAHFLMGLILLGENNATESRKSFANALSLMKHKEADDVLPCSDGMTVAGLTETIAAMLTR
jgi:chemotaxis protein methyltransferase CheR